MIMAIRPSTCSAVTTRWDEAHAWYSEGKPPDYKPVQTKPLTVDTIPLAKRTF